MKKRFLTIGLILLGTSTLAACGGYERSYTGFPYGVRTAGEGVAVYDKKPAKSADKVYTQAQQK